MPRPPLIPNWKLASNWRDVLRHAWSVRLLVIAFALSVLEVILNLLGAGLPFPPVATAILTGLVTGGAFVARLVAQKDIPGDRK